MFFAVVRSCGQLSKSFPGVAFTASLQKSASWHLLKNLLLVNWMAMKQKKFANHFGTVKLSSNLGGSIVFVFERRMELEGKKTKPWIWWGESSWCKKWGVHDKEQGWMLQYISCVWVKSWWPRGHPKDGSDGSVVRWRCPFFWRPDMLKKGSTFHPSWHIFSPFFWKMDSKSRLLDGPLLCWFALVTSSCRSDLRVYLKRYLKWHMLDWSKVSSKVENKAEVQRGNFCFSCIPHFDLFKHSENIIAQQQVNAKFLLFTCQLSFRILHFQNNDHDSISVGGRSLTLFQLVPKRNKWHLLFGILLFQIF